MFALLVSGGSVSANRHLIVSYGEVKRSLWNSGRRGVSLDMESKGRFQVEDSVFTKLWRKVLKQSQYRVSIPLHVSIYQYKVTMK